MPVSRHDTLCRRAVLMALLSTTLAACAQTEAAISPFSEPTRADASGIGKAPTLLVATTRRPTQDGAPPYFNSDRGSGLIFAEARLAPPGRGIAGQVSSVVSGDWAVMGVDKRSSSDAAGKFAQAATGSDVLIYVHGYNETFESAATNAGQLSHALAFEGRTGIFTWPSGGKLLDYAYDRESALWSRDAFAQVLKALSANPTVGRIHIVAHSMGSFLTLETLRELRDAPDVVARLGAIVFASPDVDIDAFEQAVTRLGTLAPRMTLIIDPGDRALAISSKLAGGVARAGSADRARLESLGVRVADTSGRGWSLLRHSLFLSNSGVTQVVKRALERAGA